MLCKIVALGPGLVLWSALALAQPLTSDTEVTRGIKQVEDGDYDAAILTLDTAARRLSSDPSRSRDLSQAYLYLGIAYVGKGHEAAAKAKFREAVKQMKDLSLSPEKYPPRVIDLFEAAKDEAAKSAAAPVVPAAPVKKGGGGSKKGVLIGGLGLAAAGGAVLALKGGGDGGGGCDTVFVERNGLLTGARAQDEFTVGPATGGAWKAELSWRPSVGVVAAASGSRALPNDIRLFIVDASRNPVTDGRLLTTTSSIAEWNGASGAIFIVGLQLQGSDSLSYQMSVNGPCK